MGFGGYINPITLEAHINYNTPMFNMPTTISHEIAHQLGILLKMKQILLELYQASIQKTNTLNTVVMHWD